MTNHEQPLVVEFKVNSDIEKAFDTWTEKTGIWWPKDHTLSGDPRQIVFESSAGGRIVETSSDGTQHVWGDVLAWERPHLIEFRWYLFFDPASATHVRLTFTHESDVTCIRLEQTGFTALGAEGLIRRERTVHGWAAIASAYQNSL
ncbi:MAG: SRPBCC domain-containing protein [Actinobacteria bacterium]|nr:SRPBCC domain-containing protein [Actinomycetota bacterium]